MSRVAAGWLLLMVTAGAAAEAQNFTADVTVTSADPDFILWETDGKLWYLEADQGDFRIAQSAGNTEIFVIEDSAPAGSFHLASDGSIGIGTTAPMTDFEIFDPDGSNLASLGLSTGSETWVIATCTLSNCGSGVTGFNIFDGSTPSAPSPFQIHEGAPNGALVIDTSGVRIYGAVIELSSREAKTRIERVDPSAVLERVLALPIARWSYREDVSGARHLGPMAEDFRAAFGLGVDGRGISTLDTSGVALAAIQGLEAEHAVRLAELAEAHEKEVARLRSRLAALETVVRELVGELESIP